MRKSLNVLVKVFKKCVCVCVCVHGGRGGVCVCVCVCVCEHAHSSVNGSAIACRHEIVRTATRLLLGRMFISNPGNEAPFLRKTEVLIHQGHWKDAFCPGPPGLKCCPQRCVPSLWMRGAWCWLHAPPPWAYCAPRTVQGTVSAVTVGEEWCSILEKSDVTSSRRVMLHPWEECCYILEKSDVPSMRRVRFHPWEEWCYILEKSDVTFLRKVILHPWDD